MSDDEKLKLINVVFLIRSQRQKKQSLLDDALSHLWKDCVTDNKTHWYSGSVLSVIRGIDGDEDALYEVQYDGDDEIYKLDILAADLRDSQLRFIDI